MRLRGRFRILDKYERGGRIMPTLHENTLIMRVYQGEGEVDATGEKFELSTTTTGAPVVEYKGRIVTWSWQELLEEAVKMIDEAEEVQNG